MSDIDECELRDDCAAILRRVRDGESFTITRDGAPIAEFQPWPKGPQRYVSREVLLRMTANWPPIDSAQFRRDLDEIADPWF